MNAINEARSTNNVVDITMLNYLEKILNNYNIQTFARIDKLTYEYAVNYAKDLHPDCVFPEYSYPLPDDVYMLFDSLYSGWSDDKNIYISDRLEGIELLKILIHEITHVNNSANSTYSTQHEQYYHEFNAELQEWYLTNPSKRFTRGEYVKLEQTILDKYDVDETANNNHRYGEYCLNDQLKYFVN
jgi:hypothetical protein